MHKHFAERDTLHQLAPFNPYHAEFLKWNNPPYIFLHFPLSFLGISG